MRRVVHKRWWFAALSLLVSVVAFRHMWLWLPAHRYQSLISHGDLLSALNAEDDQQVAKLAGKYHYDYQIFRNSQLAYTSSAKLPAVRLFQTPSLARGVIVNPLAERLRATEPYQAHIALHRYIFFAVTPRTADRLTYIIYGKVL
ncbi:MAG TPA: hypothetical protein VLG11_00660 [Candidatus Saccharimonadales bacterium]|nr:hypothetical protein [Candidatus Saccharimonadales bacterium]